MKRDYEPFGSLEIAAHLCDEGEAGRIGVEGFGYIKAEITMFRKIAAARDATVSANTEGLVTRNPSITSARAAAKVSIRSGTQRAAILAEIVRRGGCSDFELSHRLRLLASSVRPRRLELVQGGFVVDSGRTRQHRGTAWTLWAPTAEALAWYARQGFDDAEVGAA